MKEIKRYTLYKNSIADHTEYCLSDDVDQLITDHKAVVETMQKRIDELEAENETLINCENCRFEPCDNNSECDFCQKYSRWQNNIGINKV